MKANSPAALPSTWERLNRWGGWSGLAVSAGVLLLAAGVLVLSYRVPAAAPEAVAVNAVLAEGGNPWMLKGGHSRATDGLGLPPGTFDSIIAGQLNGRAVLHIRVSPNGPTIVVDARSGEFIEQTASRGRRLPSRETLISSPVVNAPNG